MFLGTPMSGAAVLCAFAALALLWSTPVHAQDEEFLWAGSFGAVGETAEGNAIAVDDAGNVYTTGMFEGTVDFDPGPGVFELTSAGDKDIFVQKLDRDGSFVWAHAMGGTSWDQGHGIAVDSVGNVHITGEFRNTADFNPDLPLFELTAVGEADIFVQKLDSDGNLMWARAMGGTESDFGYDIAVDGMSNVYTTGGFGGTVDFDPGLTTVELTATVGGVFEDVFVQKLDVDGIFVWARAVGGDTDDQGNGIAVDSAGNVHIIGDFGGTVDFDPGPGTVEFSGSVFIQKLDSDGLFVWAGALVY